MKDGCFECSSWPEGLRTASSCLHEDVAAELVRGLKYGGHFALAGFLARRMVEPARRIARGRSPLLVPIPLAPSRRRERGFNQAELIASALGRCTGWEVVCLLRRITGGPSLTRKGRRERARLTHRTYTIDATELLSRPAREAGILLVDDVITTGATVTSCFEALRGADVECIGAVSFARTGASLSGN